MAARFQSGSSSRSDDYYSPISFSPYFAFRGRHQVSRIAESVLDREVRPSLLDLPGVAGRGCLVRSGGDARFLKTGRPWPTWPPSGDQRTVPRQQIPPVAAATVGGRGLSYDIGVGRERVTDDVPGFTLPRAVHR